MGSNESQSPGTSPDAAEVQLVEEVVAVIDALKGDPFTMRAVTAVVEIRQHRATLAALETLILAGKVSVEQAPKGGDNSPLAHYVFRARSDDEQDDAE